MLPSPPVYFDLSCSRQHQHLNPTDIKSSSISTQVIRSNHHHQPHPLIHLSTSSETSHPMRKAFATLALALAGSASAAVIAVDTGHESPTAIERAAAPELIKRDGDSTSTSTSTTTRTSTVWDTVTVWMKPSSTGSSTSSSTSPSIVKQQNVAFAAADETITMVETITATVVAQPVVTVYVNPSSAGTLFGEKAKAVDDTSDIHHPDELVAPHVKRNAVDERGMEFASMIVTQFTTSTIPGVSPRLLSPCNTAQ
jgi:hypothetical protein